MAQVFDSLGIYGVSQVDEILMLQSLITGDPLLMIGEHGSAKTAAANSIAKALNISFQAYDASKSMFEDLIGFPNPSSLQQGKMQYIQGEITIWDKVFVFVDEVNRAMVENQSKWLEVLRSRKIMGLPLETKFIWGAMNPMGYEGAQLMDEAYVGRFSTFVYVPNVLDMEHNDRSKVIDAVGVDDCPAAGFWTGDNSLHGTSSAKQEKVIQNSEKLIKLLTVAQEQYAVLSESEQLKPVTSFLSKFAKALYARTKPSGDDKDSMAVKLDGRRLGMMRRTLVATRAMAIAHSNVYGSNLKDFADTAGNVIKATIPTGVNSEGGVDRTTEAHIENVYQQLADHFSKNPDMRIIDLTYELMVSDDIIRKAQILLNEDVREITRNSAWTRILESTTLDVSVLSLLALNIEIATPGTLPPNVVDQMKGNISDDLLEPNIPNLEGPQLEFFSDFDSLIKTGSNIIERVLICYNIKQTIESTRDGITGNHIKKLKAKCKTDIEKIQVMCKRPWKQDDVSSNDKETPSTGIQLESIQSVPGVPVSI